MMSLVSESFYPTHFSVRGIGSGSAEWMKCEFSTGGNREMKESNGIQLLFVLLWEFMLVWKLRSTEKTNPDNLPSLMLINVWPREGDVNRAQFRFWRLENRSLDSSVPSFSEAVQVLGIGRSILDSQRCHYSSWKLFNLPKLQCSRWQPEDTHITVHLTGAAGGKWDPTNEVLIMVLGKMSFNMSIKEGKQSTTKVNKNIHFREWVPEELGVSHAILNMERKLAP